MPDGLCHCKLYIMTEQTKYIFLSGDGSGAGKTSIAMGILDQLIHTGVPPHQLAYIKPCTQCEAVQLLWKYCYNKGIEFVSYNAPVIYYSGYTHSVLDNDPSLPESDRTVESRRHKVKQAIEGLASGGGQSHGSSAAEYGGSGNDNSNGSDSTQQRKKYVVIDGVGYPAVGSCVGLSNADVASLVSAPVVLVGKSGVGNAIDSMNYVRTFFEYNHCTVIGGIFNKIQQTSYHKVEDTIKFTQMYFQQNVPSFHVYGYVPVVEQIKDSKPQAPVEGASCRRKMANKDELKLGDVEGQNMENWLAVFGEKVDFAKLVQDVDAYWSKQASR